MWGGSYVGWCVFFFQAEDGIRDLVRSRGLGVVYKRQGLGSLFFLLFNGLVIGAVAGHLTQIGYIGTFWGLSLIHI